MSNEERLVSIKELGKDLTTSLLNAEIMRKIYKKLGISLTDDIVELAKKYKKGEITEEVFKTGVRELFEPYIESVSRHGRDVIESICMKYISRDEK